MKKLSRLLSLAVIFIIVISLASCQTLSKRKAQALSFYKLGVSQLMVGNYQGAYVKFHESLRFDPNNKDVFNGLGSVHMGLDDLEQAEIHFKKAVRIDKTFSEALNNLCYVNYVRKQYDTAIAYCRRAISNPLYATPEKAFYNIGRSYYQMKKYDASAKAFNKAVKRHPNFFPGYYAMALTFDADKKFGAASRALGIAIGLDPMFKGNKSLAEHKFRSLIGTSPDSDAFEQMIEILHY